MMGEPRPGSRGFKALVRSDIDAEKKRGHRDGRPH